MPEAPSNHWEKAEASEPLRQSCDTLQELRSRVQNTIVENQLLADIDRFKTSKKLVDKLQLAYRHHRLQRLWRNMGKIPDENQLAGLGMAAVFNPSPRDFEKVSEKLEIDVAHSITPEQLLRAMADYEGYEYEFGSKSGNRKSIDCSGLITESLKKLRIVKGPYMSAHGLWKLLSVPKAKDDEPEVGDFVHWVSTEDRRSDHIAIVNTVLPDGRVKVTQSASSKGGYDEGQVIDLKKKSHSGKYRYALSRPIFYAE